MLPISGIQSYNVGSYNNTMNGSHDWCDCGDNFTSVGERERILREPFFYQFPNGNRIIIDKIRIQDHRNLVDQYLANGRVEIKFCVEDDEAYMDGPEIEGLEKYVIVLFPMYDVDGEVRAHDTVVAQADSFQNGNLEIQGKNVIRASYNYPVTGYSKEDVFLELLAYVQRYVEDHLRRHSF